MKIPLALFFAATALAPAGGIYWTNRGAGLLERSRYDGAGRATVLANAGTNVRGLALDPATNQIYYADNGADMLYKLDLNGSNRSTVLSVGPGAFPADLRLDTAAGHLYYCDRDKFHVRRINLNGTNPLPLVTDSTYQPYYLDLDIGGGKIYWSDFDGVSANTGNVFRMNLDGSGRETIVTGNLETRAVCVDPAGGMLYWVNRNAGRIMRCQLSDLPVSATDATKVQTLYSNLDTPHGMALDISAGKVYWVDTGTNGFPNTLGDVGVSRGDMDGSGPHEVLVDLVNNEPWDIEVDPRCASYAEWRARYFIKNPGDSAAAEADPDHDAIVNVMEFGLGLHPRRPDVSGLPVIVQHSEGGLDYPAIRFTRRTGTTDLTVLPQHSTDLDYWWDDNSPTDGLPRLTRVSATPLPEGLELVTVRSVFPLQQMPRQYLRVLVAVTP